MQDVYAEWVGIRAKIALLEANAICLVYLLTDKADTLQDVKEMMETVSPRYPVSRIPMVIPNYLCTISGATKKVCNNQITVLATRVATLCS